MERFTENGAFKERCNGNIPYAEIICFVQKTEDVLEKYGIESVEELDEMLEKSIVPKFKIGQEVFYYDVDVKKIIKARIIRRMQCLKNIL